MFHEQIFPYAKEQTETYEDIFSSATESDKSSASTSESPDVMNDSQAEEHPTPKVSKAEAKRISKLPAHLKDYYCNISECDTEIPYPMSSYMSPESF